VATVTKKQCIILFTRVKTKQIITYLVSGQTFGADTREVITVVIKRPDDESLGYEKKLLDILTSLSRISECSCLRQTSTNNQSTCAVWFSKIVFDSICHDQLWVTILDIRYTMHLLAKLYRKEFVMVNVERKTS